MNIADTHYAPAVLKQKAAQTTAVRKAFLATPAFS
jgi:hypothetical protein